MADLHDMFVVLPLPRITSVMALGLAIGSIVIGLLTCFFGYRLFMLVLGLVGGLICGPLGYAATFEASAEPWLAIAGGVVGAMVGAALFVLLYWVGIFAMGAAFGVGLATATMLSLDVQPHAIGLIVAGVAAGVIAVLLQKTLIILATSFGGALAVSTGAADLIHRDGSAWSALPEQPGQILPWLSQQYSPVVLIGALALGAVGAIVQFAFTARHYDHARARE